MTITQDNSPLVAPKEALTSLSQELSDLMVHLEELEKTYIPRVTRHIRTAIEDAQNQQAGVFNDIVQAEWTQESNPENAVKVAEEAEEKALVLQEVVDQVKEDLSILASAGDQYTHVYSQALALSEELSKDNDSRSYDYSRVAKFSADLRAIDRIKNREPVQSVHDMNDLIIQMQDFKSEVLARKALNNAVIDRKKQLSNMISFSTGVNAVTVAKMKAQIARVKDASGEEGMEILDTIEQNWNQLKLEKTINSATKDAEKLLAQLRSRKPVRTKAQMFTINDIKFLDQPSVQAEK